MNSLERMSWYNEPEKWQIGERSLSMFVTPKTDFWRVTHYGFTVDDGPFYYTEVGGEFEVKVKISGEYRTRFDQMGLMLRIDEKTWIKAGVEYVNEKVNLSAVVTHGHSDWSVNELTHLPKAVWLKAVRRLDAVEMSFSLDGEFYSMMRLAFFPAGRSIMVGLTAASPDGEGFDALFEEFEIKHLPDKRRLQWLRDNA